MFMYSLPHRKVEKSQDMVGRILSRPIHYGLIYFPSPVHGEDEDDGVSLP